MPWKAASTVSAGQTMQTPTVHPPAAAAIKRNTNISAHSKGNSNPKTLGVQKCPKRRNRQNIEQIPTLYLCRGQQSGSRHMVCYMQLVFQFLSTTGRSYAFWRLGSSGMGASPLAPLQDSTASASSLVSAVLILERIVSTNSPTEFIEARKEGSAISSALLQPKPPKFTGNSACLHTSPSNDMLSTFPRESKRALSKMRNSSLHK